MRVSTSGQRLQRLRDAGFKLTNARVTVLNVLEASHDHMTSAQVIDAVSSVDPGIGRASVFRSLDLLTNLAIIRPTYIDSSVTPKYVLLPDGHHHHIVCTRCNRVIEFDDCGLSELARRLESQYEIKITGHLLEFFARCNDCVMFTADDDSDEAVS
ncbi:MAG TPA: Fur family transcriptional regulator [Phototrophicaceae bacterium]|jgi:Fur family ferric uptake transcriptional regulator|nr:Fur family transcriptional regulator [Phototrophicaceae bacterium]